MRTLIGISIGATLVILAHTLGWPFLAWALTRIPPATVNPDRKPIPAYNRRTMRLDTAA